MTPATSENDISIVGAGLVGSLLAIFLAKRGLHVTLYERRPDPRKIERVEGRSINLAISARGIHSLRQIGVEEAMLREAIPMRGRMMHSIDGKQTFQFYGKDETQFINSISRTQLNYDLLELAEEEYKVSINFNQKLLQVDFEEGILEFENLETNEKHHVQSDLIFGADGSGSIVRKSMLEQGDFDFQEIDSGAAYKELTILPNDKGEHKMEVNALHIWPRKSFMLIALPNFDGSYTCTLFLPQKGPNSFEELNTPEKVEQFFQNHFPDTMDLIDHLTETFFINPTGRLTTLKCFPWTTSQKNGALIGDAAHAIIPFFGQGMNCGFEDCTALQDLLDGKSINGSVRWEEVLSEFETLRKPQADAIAQMSIENFVEMRDHVGDPKFLLRKAIEKTLEERFPDQYVSRYCLVSFSRTPYDKAYAIGEVQREILEELCQNIQTPEELDLEKAQNLIRTKLSPFIEKDQKE